MVGLMILRFAGSSSHPPHSN